jgi:hypothetical protein
VSLDLTSTIPADDAFESAFATMQASKASLARYFLRVLEQQERGVAEPENIPNDDPLQITLEHVLPQEVVESSEWNAFDQEQRALFTGRLGNLALLQSGPNSTLQSKPFDEKRKVYEESGYLLTKEIAAESGWNPATVAKRQKRLARIAIKAWPITS